GNVYLNRREPWKLVKSSREEAGAVLYTASQAVKALALLLHPFTPNTSEKILAMLSEKPAEALWTGDRPWLLPPGARIAKPTPLFEKLTDEKLESIKAGQAVQ
ncbi:MAG: class I tRNA ligase family protein, partial [Candidatus Caldarchaeum sp.]|nr:class I tRNA ligase family protein [Candidatus Caldarchaeum sp.]